MTGILLVAQFILTAILTIAVLLQKSSSIGLGAYSGSNESLFGAKGPAGFLAKFTFGIAFLFVVNTLALGYMYNTQKGGSIAEEIDTTIPAPAETPLPQAPQAPQAPKAE
jgi:preprotein translocase subunit SecG